MEGEWSCYRGGQFKGGRMIMFIWVTLLEGERSCQRVRGGSLTEGE